MSLFSADTRVTPQYLSLIPPCDFYEMYEVKDGERDRTAQTDRESELDKDGER